MLFKFVSLGAGKEPTNVIIPSAGDRIKLGLTGTILSGSLKKYTVNNNNIKNIKLIKLENVKNTIVNKNNVKT